MAAAAASRPDRYRARTRSPPQASEGPATLVPWTSADRRGPPPPPSRPARPCSLGHQDLEGAHLGGDHVPEHAWKCAELPVLGRVSQRDGLSKQTDCASLDEDISVDTTQRDLSSVAATRHVYCLVHLKRQAQGPRKVVERSKWQDADRMLGVGETPDHELHRSIPACYDHTRARRDELLEVQLGVEVDDEVVRERSPETGFEVGCHATGAAADDEKPAGRGGGLGRAQWRLPSRRTHRAQAKE